MAPITSNKHESFVTTTRGLNRQSAPMRLFEKAKRFGVWNPSDIDLGQDKADWQKMAPDERDLMMRLTAQFAAGEEAVTLDLLPLMLAIAREGRTEEEMFLTTFLWEEAKHTDYFQRLMNEVMDVSAHDLTAYHTENYRAIFYEALPEALNRLMTDPTPENQLRASVTYNMIVEGVLAETGYHGYFTALQRNNLMPGNTQAILKLKQDESRHIAYGIYLISRLVAEHPDLWPVVEDTMNALFAPALGIVQENFSFYDPVPFGLDLGEFTGYAMMQFQKRYARIEQARGTTLNDVEKVTHAAIDADDV